MELASELDTPRSKIREAFRLLAQDKLVHIIPQRATTICKLNLGATIDSIFIIQSLLAAIMKDCMPIPAGVEKEISRLEQDLIKLDQKDTIEEDDFFDIDHQFYLTLCRARNFQRLTTIIFKEKIHIDRALRLVLKQQESCKPIISFYRQIFTGIREKNTESALMGLCGLANTLEDYSIKAEQYFPQYFQ